MIKQVRYEYRTRIKQWSFLLFCLIAFAIVIICEQTAFTDPDTEMTRNWFEEDHNGFNAYYENNEDFTGVPYDTFADFLIDHEKYRFVHASQDTSPLIFLVCLFPAFFISGAFDDRTINWSRWAGIQPWKAAAGKLLVCLPVTVLLEVLGHLFTIFHQAPNWMSYFTFGHFLRCLIVRAVITLVCAAFGTAFALLIKNIILSAVGYFVLLAIVSNIVPKSLRILSSQYDYLYRASATWNECVPIILGCIAASVIAIVLSGLAMAESCRHLE